MPRTTVSVCISRRYWLLQTTVLPASVLKCTLDVGDSTAARSRACRARTVLLHVAVELLEDGRGQHSAGGRECAG